jgi:ESCRT-II complex subunit VPS36
MAQALNSRLSTQDTDASATLVRSSLVSLGLPSPVVTPDMVATELAYHDSLARELAGVLARSRLVLDRGLVALDEVWCHWNRARGLALVSPRDLRQVVALLPSHTRPPLATRAFRSGLVVLHTPRYAIDAFAARVLPMLDATTLEVARTEGLSASLAGEMLETLEADEGVFVRDQIGAQTRWWPNLLLSYVWEDPNRAC